MLNMNHYRNTHYRKLNIAKEAFLNRVKPEVDKLPTLGCVRLTYTLFTPNKRLVDTANVCCVADKFFSDALVECARIEDDNYNIVEVGGFYFGGIDKENPRVEVNILPIGSTGRRDPADNPVS